MALTIFRKDFNPTSASEVTFEVNFFINVVGVDAADFTLTTTGDVTGAHITSVSGGFGPVFTVTVETGTGDGTLQLNVIDNGTITVVTNVGTAPLSTVLGVGPTVIETYTLDADADMTLPTILSFERVGPSQTNAASVEYVLKFSEDVTGVDAQNFQLKHTGFSTAPTISNVSGSGSTWTVTVDTGSGDGEVSVDFNFPPDSITDTVGHKLDTTGAGIYFTYVDVPPIYGSTPIFSIPGFPPSYPILVPGYTFTTGHFDSQSNEIDRTSPEVQSIVRVGPEGSAPGSLQYTVTFSEAVTGVDVNDFTLTTSGLSGASVTNVSGSDDTWVVTVNTGTGGGTIRLDFVDDDTVTDVATNAAGGAGAGNANFTTGEAYVINTAPILTGDMNATIDEGGSYAPQASDLGYIDADDDPANVFYTVTDLTNLQISVNYSSRTTFSAAEVAAGLVQFSHDDSETTTASFKVYVEDGNEDGSTPVAQIFTFDVTPRDDAPSRIGDSETNITEGSAYTIQTSDLYVRDDDDDVSGLVFDISDVTRGTLLVDGVEASTFTAGQIAAGQVVFQHDGSEVGRGIISVRLSPIDGRMWPYLPIYFDISRVNDAPVNTVPGAQAVEVSTSTAITGLGIADADAGSGNLTTTLSVLHGTLAATGTGVSGSGTATLTIVGTLVQINAALATVAYTGGQNYLGPDTLTMITNDGGNSGAGGALSDTDHVAIQVGTVITGTEGDNGYVAPAGPIQIDALHGTDTMTFGFKLTEADISFVGDKVIIDGSGAHYAVLSGFEKYVFTDGTVNNADGNDLVDDLFYFSRNHDVWNIHMDADAHYEQYGWRELRDPNEFFSTVIYLSENPQLKGGTVSPVTHFHQTGWKSGLAPSLNFDPAAYLDANPDVKAAGLDPLEHFLYWGRQEGREPIAPTEIIGKGGFDYVYYLQQNPDVAAANIDPLLHFNTIGWKQGRDPNAFFDTSGYLAVYTDVAAINMNPLDHYNQYGWKEGRDPSLDFDTKAYLAINTDVAAAQMNPLIHYLTYGQHEGRVAIADAAWWGA